MTRGYVVRSRFANAALGAAVFGSLIACGGGDSSPVSPTPPAAEPLGLPFSVEDLEEGTGPAAEEGWLVAIAFTAWIYDPDAANNEGTVVGSASAADPAGFRVGIGQVLPGVDQGVLGMHVGGTRRVVVPPELGLGSTGSSTVPPNATLLYEIELLAADAVPFSATDLVVGDGAEAESGQTLSVVYRGWLYDLLAEENKGDLFDSNTEDNPYTFTVGAGAVIEGWDLGIPGMRVGGTRRLVLPHDLAYGTTGNGPIPAYATLLFEVELLAIE